MQPERQSPFTFIVRLWREKSDSESIWRGSVDNARNGERLYFQNIERLKEVIAQMMEKTFDVDQKGDERE